MIDLELAKKPKVEIPESYENTKVYSLDEDVIRKYAELCGKSIENDDEEYVRAGYGMRRNGLFSSFVAGSRFDGDDSLTTITPEQILASWDLKLNEPSIETLQSALDKSQLKVMELTEQLAEKTKELDCCKRDAVKLDHEIYLLKQGNQNPPRTKVEYVKCEFEHAWQAVKASDDGEVLFEKGNDDHYESLTSIECYGAHKLGRLFRRTEVEVEIDVKDVVAEWGHKNKIGIFSPQEFQFDYLLETNKSKAIEMCHLVAELTDKPE